MMIDETQSTAFNTLAHPRRIKIFNALNEPFRKSANFGELASLTRIPEPSLTHHIRVLVQGGLVIRKPKGRFTEFSVNPDLLVALNSATLIALRSTRFARVA